MIHPYIGLIVFIALTGFLTGLVITLAAEVRQLRKRVGELEELYSHNERQRQFRRS